MLCLKVMNDTKYVIFTDLQRGITQLVNMLEASKFHRNVNRIFFFPSDQITIPALTSGANVNLKKKRHNQHHRNRDKMRAIPNLPYARTAATVATFAVQCTLSVGDKYKAAVAASRLPAS